MKNSRFLILFLLSAVALFFLAASEIPPPTNVTVNDTYEDLSKALDERILNVEMPKNLGLTMFSTEMDEAFISPDGKSAVLWLAIRDDTGRILATEPGLAIGLLSDSGWQVIFRGDPDWEESFASLPKSVLPIEQQSLYKTFEFDTVQLATPLTGYYLPFAAGTKQWLEGSISHFQNIPELGYPSCEPSECRYAYDFTNLDHFPLVASKDGTVHVSRDSCNDGDPTCTNYIVLKDTNNQTYQIYIHLAYGTIPDKLTNGTFVKRGQYIGDTDDTGYSTSQHVHFMVVDSIYSVYWGRSIDVRFADVPINGGIPRTCYEVTNFPIYDGAKECLGNKLDPRNPTNDWFISGNVGAYPPTGILTRPLAGASVTSGDITKIDVTASASDDVRVNAVQLVAKLNNQWVEIGEKETQPDSTGIYDWDVDLCTGAPVNGALEVALRVWDHEGNVASALSPRTINVDHACPPPTSQLNPAVGFDSTAVQLNWDAINNGAGISSFELQWRAEPGTWGPSNIATIPGNQRTAWFVGTMGGSYAFRLRVIDNNNQRELWPDDSETSVSLPASCVPDNFEPDDDPGSATTLPLDVKTQRNLCGVGNADWFNLTLETDQNYQIRSASINGGAAVKITIFSNDGETVLFERTAAAAGLNTEFIFSPENAGSYLVKIEPFVGHLVGTAAIYELSVAEVSLTYLPVILR